MSSTYWNWYVAQFVVEFRVASDPEEWVRLVVVLQSYLFHADSEEEAYAKAKTFGEALCNSHHNAQGDLITMTCKGMYDLDNLQVDTLKDEDFVGAFRMNDVTSAQIEALITPRERLSVFEADFVNSPENNPNICDA